tara:strand:+ start:168 stop:413 length:246 start_codon:yes stop_codon:yes gene_type:complete
MDFHPDRALTSNYIRVIKRVEKGFQLTDDANEALEDLASIARISIEFDEDGECDYIELVEYVRIAVQLIYMDVNATKKLTH